jgi:hypothetical protein
MVGSSSDTLNNPEFQKKSRNFIEEPDDFVKDDVEMSSETFNSFSLCFQNNSEDGSASPIELSNMVQKDLLLHERRTYLQNEENNLYNLRRSKKKRHERQDNLNFRNKMLPLDDKIITALEKEPLLNICLVEKSTNISSTI